MMVTRKGVRTRHHLIIFALYSAITITGCTAATASTDDDDAALLAELDAQTPALSDADATAMAAALDSANAETTVVVPTLPPELTTLPATGDSRGLPLDLPVVGTVYLQSVKNGFKVGADQLDKASINLAPIFSFNKPEISIINSKLGISGQATFLGKAGTVSLKKIAFQEVNKKQRIASITLSFTFDQGQEPHVEIIPGAAWDLTSVDLNFTRPADPTSSGVAPAGATSAGTTSSGTTSSGTTSSNADTATQQITACDGTKVTIDPTKTTRITAIAKTTIGGKIARIGFDTKKYVTTDGRTIGRTDAYLKFASMPITELIPGLQDTPLSAGKLTNCVARLNCFMNEKSAPNTATFIAQASLDLGTADIAQDELLSAGASGTLKNLGFKMIANEKGFTGRIEANKLPIVIGDLNNAAIIFKARTTGTKKKITPTLTLTGDVDFNVPEIGKLNLAVNAQIAKKITFSANVNTPGLKYSGLSFDHLTADYANQKMIFTAQSTLFGLTGTVLIQVAVGTPKPSKSNTMVVGNCTVPASANLVISGNLAGENFNPFGNLKLGILSDISISNVHASVCGSSGKKPETSLTGVIKFKGQEISSIIRPVDDGWYVEIPLAQRDSKNPWTLHELIPAPGLESIQLSRLSIIVCSATNGCTNNAGEHVAQGASIDGLMPLSATLAPLAKIAGVDPSLDLAFSATIPDNPQLFELRIALSNKAPDDKARFSVGNSSIIINGNRKVALEAQLVARPTDKDKLTFAAEFGYDQATTAAVEFAATLSGSGGAEGRWVHPFGIPLIEFYSVHANGAVEITSDPPLPEKIGMSGKFAISDKVFTAAAQIDLTGKDNAILGKLDGKLTLGDLIGLFNDMAHSVSQKIPTIPDDVKNLLQLEIEDVEARMAFNDVQIGEIIVRAGLTLKGKTTILGTSALVEISIIPPALDTVGTMGIRICGETSRIDVGNLGLLVISNPDNPDNVTDCKRTVSAAAAKSSDLGCGLNQKVATNQTTLVAEIQTVLTELPTRVAPVGPHVRFELTPAAQLIDIAGSVQIADVFKDDCLIHLSKDGFEFCHESFLGPTKDPLLKALIQVIGSGSIIHNQFDVTVGLTFEDNTGSLRAYLQDQIKQGIAIAQTKVTQGIQDAQKQIDKIEGTIAAGEKGIADARSKVAQAKADLAAIAKAKASMEDAISNAQKSVTGAITC